MKVRIWTLLLALAIALTAGTGQATAAVSQHAGAEPTVRQPETCFRAHGKLMSKLAVMNIYDCWRAHGYLMRWELHW